jgi:hypothetical protein
MTYQTCLAVPHPTQKCPNCSADPQYRSITVEEYNIFGTGHPPGLGVGLWAIGALAKSAFKKGVIATAAELISLNFAKDRKSMGVVICMACKSFIVTCPHCFKTHPGRAAYSEDWNDVPCPHCNNLMSD